MNQTNVQLVEQYAAGGDRLSDAIRGWGHGDMRRLPPAGADPELGKWSVQQIIIHLEDAELSFADRLRRVIAMEQPALLKWDENQFAQRLHYEDQSAVDAIELIRLTRRQMGRVLRKLSDSEFERIGIHNERGPQKLSAIIGFADWHLNHHLEFVEKKRLAFNI